MNGIDSNLSSASSNFCFKLPPAGVEFPRRRALEGEDRLLLVADRKHRAHHAVARAGAGGEFRDDMRDDVPLPGAGVLRLVDQHVIDAAVELVVHPAGRAAGQQGQRLVDQIVIVEQAAFGLFAPVIGGDRDRDMQQGFGAVARQRRRGAFRSGDRRRLDLGVETARRGRHCRVRNPLVSDRFARRRLASVRNTPRYSST